MKRALFFSAMLLASCGPKVAPTPPAGNTSVAFPAASTKGEEPEDPKTRAMVAAMMKRVEAAHELKEKSHVRSKTLTRAALLDQVRAHADTDQPKSVTLAQGEFLAAFGLIPPTYDYEKGMFDLLESQLAGYYEPADKTMYLAGDLSKDDAEATLAHELVHALQDQYYDLAPKMEYRDDGGDSSAAIHAMAEGDAMSAMVDVMFASAHKTALDIPDGAMAMQMRAMTMMSPDTANIPPVLKASLIAPYIDGLIFVNGVRREGGWAAVDRVWKNPPTTTEQLLHLEKYMLHEKELEVPGPPLDALGGTWTSLYSDHMGEEGVRIAFEDWGSANDAARAASGWGGDRVSVLSRKGTNGDEHLIVWWVRYDGNPTDCAEANEAFPVASRFASPGPRHGVAATVCRERADLGPAAVAKFGCDVLLVAGPYFHTEAKWTSAGTCNDVQPWMEKVLKH